MRKGIAMLLTLLLMATPLTACGSLPHSVGDLFGSNSSGYSENEGIGYAVDGCAEGYLGDTMHTVFFDFTINSAYTCMEFDGLKPAEGYQLLVAEITLYNTTGVAQPMYFWDFQLQWDVEGGGNNEEAFGYPLYEEIQNEDGVSDFISVSDLQLPTHYDLDIGETRTGILLYAVPENAISYSISFQEYILTEEDEEELGDVFFVWFSAPEQ